MAAGFTRQLSVDDMMDLVVTCTVCFGIMVLLLVIAAFALMYPTQVQAFFGEFAAAKGTGLGAVFVFLFMVLQLVYKKRGARGGD